MVRHIYTSEARNQEAYDAIAPSWYNLHHWSRFSTELERLAARWQRGRLLNIGCGHGADFLPFKDHFELHGVDISSGMLQMARRFAQKFGLEPDLRQASATSLPFRHHSFDWAIAIAVYHHLATPAERLKAFQELKRVLKPQGEAFVTVWNHGQDRFCHEPQDVCIPWHQENGTINRFYHLFTYEEAYDLAVKAGFAILTIGPEASYQGEESRSSANICLLLSS